MTISKYFEVSSVKLREEYTTVLLLGQPLPKAYGRVGQVGVRNNVAGTSYSTRSTGLWAMAALQGGPFPAPRVVRNIPL